ncbi:MAG: ABC transporter permease [Candidatus Hadarchaeum sp.]|uniref:ABC transporter permease n=1 Tax=Candidatus Hadarchaeum sp. TaxID=2883567 RepID=UPI0031709211
MGLCSLVIGLFYGVTAGYSRTIVDNIMMRIVDYLYGFPSLIVVILLQVYVKALGKRGAGGIAGALLALDKALGGLLFLFIVLGMLNWLQMARIARGLVLSLKRSEFIDSARAVGASHMRIIFKHILPNILGPCIVAVCMEVPGYIFTEAFLSFLGLGVNPPIPSWGIMIAETYTTLRSNPILILGPAFALSMTTLAFNFLGDGIRDALDPRMRGARALKW